MTDGAQRPAPAISPSAALPGVPIGGTLNVWSGVRNLLAFNIESPNYADISLGFEYAIALMNSTAADITTGTVILEGAEAQHDNPCEPDTFHPLDPVADCGPIVTGVPYTPPVQIDITPERPIPARGVCLYAAPCPLQFLRVTGVPAGVNAIVIITRLRRSDPGMWGPGWGIPRPLGTPFGIMGAQAPQPQAQQPQPAPAPAHRRSTAR